jgi:DNA-binding NarL/FixJ family response regulator
MKVFLVDDALMIRQRLAKILATVKGVHIIGEAVDADDAIQAIRRLHPDVVILDLQLRRGTGFEVLEAIKHDSPAPIVIVLTNFPYPRFRQKGLAAGADFFFDKSTEFQKIPNVLLHLSMKRHRRHQPLSLRTEP